MLLKQPKTRPWTKAEYYQAADLGWFDDERVELIGGEVVQMAPQRDAHAAAVSLTDYALRKVFGKGFVIRLQSPANFGARSQPEPDLLILKGSPRTVLKHPTSGVLFVEVSDTSLAFDRGRKASLYASRRILDYWIVNLIDRVVEVRRSPVAAATESFGYRYDEVIVYEKGEVVIPLAAKRAKIPVSDLLP